MTWEMDHWLAAHRYEIAAKIEEGLASAERGELLTEEQVREWMRQEKRAWIEKRARQGLKP